MTDSEHLLDVLHGAGNCRHCGEPMRSSTMFEGIASPPPGSLATGGGYRTVTLYHHSRTGHERCEGRETLAEPASSGNGDGHA